MPPAEGRGERLLLFNLRTDADDHILGFTTHWMNALAQHYAAVDVLTTHAGRIVAAPNVRVFSVGRERGYGQVRRLLRFYRLLLALLLRHRYTACFAHMQPLFAALAGGPLRLFGVPLTTWYTHRQMSRQVRLATRFSRRVVTAVPDSYPLATPKLRVTGHGVDTAFYAPPARPPAAPPEALPRVVYVARLTPIKQQAALLDAAVLVRCQVVLVGDIPDGYDDAYRRDLLARVQRLGIADRVTFAGAQTPQQVRAHYQQAAVAVNLSPPGLFDKAALEGMACAVPTIVSNPAFLPLTMPYADMLHIDTPEDVVSLTARLNNLLAQPAAQRQRIGAHLRGRVEQQHSLAALIPRLVSIVNTGELPPEDPLPPA